ncbi:MAG TPA: penicillin-binding protein [Thermoanaerobaculia bacterium]
MKRRVAWLAALFVLWVAAIGARLWSLQVAQHDEFVRRAERQQQRVIELDPPRGTIFDARGRELAVSVEVESAFAVPREIVDRTGTAARLARLLDVDRVRLERALGQDREFVWIARKLDPPVARAVKMLALPGVYFLEESKRYYPMRQLGAQVLGFVGTDNHGLAGLEANYERVVAGKPGRRTVLRDARRGSALPPGLPAAEPVPGADLVLTLDSALQQIAEEELERAVATRRAQSGSVVLLDPATGAVLAMASRPTFDPNAFRDADEAALRNRPIQDAYEPGSTFKMVTAAAALEQGVVSPADRFDCEHGAIVLAGVRIADHKSFGNLSFREIIAKSSNVGTIKTALRVPTKDFHDTIRAFGFGRATGVDLPGESAGLLMPLERWPALAKAYIAFGQGIAVTPLQLASAFAAVANGGRLVEPYIVDEIRSPEGTTRPHPAPVVRGEPVSPRTVATLRELLAGVTVEGGTGRAAAVPGYSVAGKTGTAQKAMPGRGYLADEFVASFVGWAPVAQPVFVGVVVLDDPQGGYHGGEVAAPVFGAIARRVLVARHVRPHRERPERWPFEPEPERERSEGGQVAAIDEAPVAAPEPPPPGTLPDFAGRTAREAVAVATRLELVPVLRGRGVVVRQNPPPGSAVPAPGGRVLLELDTGAGG